METDEEAEAAAREDWEESDVVMIDVALQIYLEISPFFRVDGARPSGCKSSSGE